MIDVNLFARWNWNWDFRGTADLAGGAANDWLPPADDGSAPNAPSPAVIISTGQGPAPTFAYGPPSGGNVISSSQPAHTADSFDLTDPAFWLPLSNIFPSGLNDQMDQQAIDAVDLAEWNTSLAKDLGVPWDDYRSQVQAERIMQTILSSQEAANAGGTYFFSLDPTGGPERQWRETQSSQMERAWREGFNTGPVSDAFRNVWMDNWLNPHRAGLMDASGTTYADAQREQDMRDYMQSLASLGRKPTASDVLAKATELGFEVRRVRVADGSPVGDGNPFDNTVTITQKTRIELVKVGGANGWQPFDVAGGGDEINRLQQAINASQAARRTAELALQEEIENSADLAAVQISKIIGRAGETFVEDQLRAEGWTVLGEQVRVLIPNRDGSYSLRIYDYLARSSFGSLQFLEVKTNGGQRTDHQRRADEQLARMGGAIATSRITAYPKGTTVPTTTVSVINVTLQADR